MNKQVVNDFSITVGTVNGSGSSTANNTILRAIFKMGIPVSGKNLFPSNIEGLPTWYTIRVSREGYLGRDEQQHVMVAMNPASFARDLESVAPGGAFFYADDIKFAVNRSDISVYPMPIKQILREQEGVPSELRNAVANMIYVGILSHMLDMDMEAIRAAVEFHFKGREKPVAMNMKALQDGAAWARANLVKTDPFHLAPMNKTNGLIMADGNTAAAIGSVYGGLQFAAWYPITPASSLAESLTDYLELLRPRPDGKRTYAVVQAEDELAALGMAVGAGWGGLRSMTSTSGPGLSLMTEFAGLAYYAEVPVVIWDVQRIGPSTGLPTRTSQGDLTFTAHIGHGDSHSVILLPGNVNECFEFGWKAFDIAERLQTPVFVLSDLDMGMNQWMSKPFEYPDAEMDRGKILWEKDLEARGGKWGRYLDEDQDGIPYRTLPGNQHPLASYFARGTGHDDYARYSEDAPTWHRNMERLTRKYKTAKKFVPKPVVHNVKDAKVGIICFGSTESAIQEARDQLAATGLKSGMMRVRSLPFADQVVKFIEAYDEIVVVEMNRDGQLYLLLCQEFPRLAPKLRSAAYQDGLPASASWIRREILQALETPKKKSVKQAAKKAPAKKGAKK